MQNDQTKSTPDSTIRLTDTHCHLDMEAYSEDFVEVLQRASSSGVEQIITIGIDLPSSRRAVELSRTHDQIRATIGCHPHDVATMDESTYKALGDLFESNRELIVGFGEIGLDYFKNYSDPELQRDHFSRQLSLARDLGLPIIIHNREANEDTLKILKEFYPFANGGIMHCFSGDLQYAQQVIDLGLMVSIPGIVTFKNAKTLQEVAAQVPMESLLLETDGPFLAPHPFRGKRNEPSYVRYTAEKVAELRGISLKDLAEQTSENASRLFNLNA